jgi:hypothetical protein
MIAAGLFWMALQACQSPEPARTSATLIYTDHWDGEIEPCG